MLQYFWRDEQEGSIYSEIYRNSGMQFFDMYRDTPTMVEWFTAEIDIFSVEHLRFGLSVLPVTFGSKRSSILGQARIQIYM